MLAVPIALLVVYLLVFFVWRLLGLPADEKLVAAVKDWFDEYGLWVVLISAIVEGTLILGQYYPGGIVIFLGVITAGHDIPRVIAVVAIVSLAFFIGYTIDYFVGKYGWYRLFLKFGFGKGLQNAQTKLQKHELSAVIFSYWEPNLASITATAAGVLQIPLRRFQIKSIIGILVWNTFWGTLVAALPMPTARTPAP